MIKVYIPDNNINERIYIVNVLIGEFLGLDYEIIKSNKISWEIEIENGSKLIIQDYFFNKYKNDLEYLKLENIPLSINYGQKNNNQFIPEDNIPIIFGEDKLVLDKNSKTIICGIDIFASSFFMITRWEEYVNNIRDIHDRFPGKESIAYKFGFLDRPVVNEYVEMLWNMLKYLGLNQERKKREYKIILTHDVDVPFEIIGKTLFSQLKLAISDIIFRKNIKSSIEKIKALFLSNEQKLKYDKFYTFNYIMNQSEKRNLKNIFYFLPYGSLEQKYKVKVDNPIIIKIIQEIVQRGHEIGIHGSYETYNSKFKFLNEVYHLYEILDKNKIYVKINGGRQHYLRFKIPNTFYNYLEAGLEYDSSLSYADFAGFRCGICYQFYPFDFIKRQKIKILEKPLIVMDYSLFDKRYMNFKSMEKSIDYLKKLKFKCQKYNGDFILLWHNHNLYSKNLKVIYESVLL